MSEIQSKNMDGYVYDVRSNLANINTYSACFKALGKAHSYSPWLYGAIAIPFLFRAGEANQSPVLNELPHSRIIGLLSNLGVMVEGFSAIADGNSMEQLRLKAWNAVRKAIDAGFPCFGRGFEFNRGETSVVSGYNNETGEYLVSCWHGMQHIPWQSLGAHDGLIDVHWMRPDGKPEDDSRTIREALSLAVEFAEGKLTGQHTRVGTAAYDFWVAELRKGRVDGWFFAYNTHEWDTCRSNGQRFLQEAKQRLGSNAPHALDAAIVCFNSVREKFNQVYQLFPWEQPRGLIEDSERRLQAADLLAEAKFHDEEAINRFREIVQAL